MVGWGVSVITVAVLLTVGAVAFFNHVLGINIWKAYRSQLQIKKYVIPLYIALDYVINSNITRGKELSCEDVRVISNLLDSVKYASNMYSKEDFGQVKRRFNKVEYFGCR